MPAVSVLVLNWNGRDLLPTCLSSLGKQTFLDFDVIMADNASTDGSTELTGKQFPRIRLIVLDRNYGFCGGNNRGIAVFRGHHLILLNNDT